VRTSGATARTSICWPRTRSTRGTDAMTGSPEADSAGMSAPLWVAYTPDAGSWAIRAPRVAHAAIFASATARCVTFGPIRSTWVSVIAETAAMMSSAPVSCIANG